jgi:hypothetical protein
MSAPSPDLIARARKIEGLVLHQLARRGQEAVATAAGCSVATISRLQNEHLQRLATTLAALDLKVVPVEMRCYPADKLDAILTLARHSLASVRHIEELAEDDE